MGKALSFWVSTREGKRRVRGGDARGPDDEDGDEDNDGDDSIKKR